MAGVSPDMNLEDMSTVQIPSTPPPGHSRSAQSNTTNLDKSAFASPPPLSASMTPPPSSQPVRFHSPIPLSLEPTDPFLASPPTTIRFTASSALPTMDAIASAGIDELRTMTQDLVAGIRQARMSAAHFKLQHSLLAMETHEAAQRAEVEHQMTRREVEVLQAAEQRHRATISSTPRSSVPPPQPQIDALTKTCKELEEERDEAEHRLHRAKKLIELEKDKAELLVEENMLLKRRIRENREHFTRLKSQSPHYATPRDAYTTPQRRAPLRFTESSSSHQPFAALLAADQVLSAEPASVPSTPTKLHSSKFKHGHTRGAHSLSSLHTTPARNRPVTSDGFQDPRLPLSAPASQLTNESAERERHDRDSTISVSDVEDDSEDDIPQSQASSLAADMLRKNPASQETLRLSQSAERTSNLLQSKLFGSVKKPGIDKSRSAKRRGSHGDADLKAKKARLNQGFGLGIESWSQA